jgi:DNA replication protein DnaC
MSAATASIESYALSLRLRALRRLGSSLAKEAERQHLTCEEFLAKVLLAEVDERDERGRLRRVEAAGFPRLKLLEDFDLAVAGVNPATIATLSSGSYLERSEPVVLLGDSGTGEFVSDKGLENAASSQRCRQLVGNRIASADVYL